MTRDLEILRFWILVVSVIAATGTNAFPIVYSFFNWRSRPIGRLIMLQAVTFALAMDISVIFQFFRPRSILFIFLLDVIILTAIAISTWALTIWVWKINRPERGKIVIMQLTSGAYDVTKKIAMVWLPALGTLYFALAQIWHLPSAEEVSGSILAFDTFLGVVLGISSTSYNNSDQRFAGTINIADHPDGDGSIMKLSSVDPQKLATAPEVTFKLVRE